MKLSAAEKQRRSDVRKAEQVTIPVGTKVRIWQTGYVVKGYGTTPFGTVIGHEQMRGAVSTRAVYHRLKMDDGVVPVNLFTATELEPCGTWWKASRCHQILRSSLFVCDTCNKPLPLGDVWVRDSEAYCDECKQLNQKENKQ